MLQQQNFDLNLSEVTKKSLLINRVLKFSNLSFSNQYIIKGIYSFTINVQFNLKNNKLLLDGKLFGKIMLICQRTLKPFEFIIDNNIKLGFVHDDRLFKDFPEGYEPYILKGKKLNLTLLLEEEIMLAIPMFPRNLSHHCQSQRNTPYYKSLDVNKVEQNKVNHFHTLQKLKNFKELNKRKIDNGSTKRQEKSF